MFFIKEKDNFYGIILIFIDQISNRESLIKNNSKVSNIIRVFVIKEKFNTFSNLT